MSNFTGTDNDQYVLSVNKRTKEGFQRDVENGEQIGVWRWSNGETFNDYDLPLVLEVRGPWLPEVAPHQQWTARVRVEHGIVVAVLA